MRRSRELYGDREGQHATPSEIALTLHLHAGLMAKQRPLPEAAACGAIHGPQDFRRRFPDGRMGSDPYLAKPDHGAELLNTAATALRDDLESFLAAP